MSPRFTAIIALLTATLFVAGCEDATSMPAQLENPAPDTSYRTGDSWLLAIYIAADNSLDRAASADLNELVRGGVPPNTEVLVLVDRAEHPAIPWASVDGLSEHSTAKWLRIDTAGLEELEDIGEVNMATPATLRGFAQRVEAHPAERKVVVLWDHGGGTVFAADKTATAGDGSLTAAEIAGAFQRDPDDASAGYFNVDILGFDACLMSSIEAMTEVGGIAPIFVGSAELEPARGWKYDALLDFMDARGDGLTPIELAGAMVNTYADSNAGPSGGLRTTMSAWRTNVRSLLDDYRDFMGALKELASQQESHEPLLEELYRIHLETTSYARRAGSTRNDTRRVDLGELLLNFETEEQNGDLVQSAHALHERLLSQRLYHRADGRSPNVAGLSVFFPLPKLPEDESALGADERALYAESSTVWEDLGWGELIEVLHDAREGSPLHTAAQLPQGALTVVADASSPGPGLVELDVGVQSDSLVTELEHVLLRELSDGRLVVIHDVDTALSGRGSLTDVVSFEMAAYGVGPIAGAVTETNLGLLLEAEGLRRVPVLLDEADALVFGMLYLGEANEITGLATVDAEGAWMHLDWNEVRAHPWQVSPLTFEHDMSVNTDHITAAQGFVLVMGDWVDVSDATIHTEALTKDDLHALVAASDITGNVRVEGLDLSLFL